MRAAIAAIAAMLCAASVAHADVPTKARLLADRGRASHAKGDYATAVSLYTEAYALAPSPNLLFNLAQAYRLQGDCDDAVLMYKRYIDTDPPPEALELARMHLQTVERCTRHDPVPGETISDPTPQITASTKPAAPPPDPPGGLRKHVGLGFGAGGAAALAGALYYAYQAHEASDAIEAAYRAGGKQTEIAKLDDQGRSASRYATILGVGGGLAVATGATLYVLGYRAEQTHNVVVHPTAHGAEVTVGWSF